MKELKYILFDESALYQIIELPDYQSTDYEGGIRLAKYLKNFSSDEMEKFIAQDLIAFQSDKGIIFSGYNKYKSDRDDHKRRIFCFDTDKDKCYFLSESESDILVILQKTFRVAYKLWNNKPFSVSERLNKNKSIVFPFAITDKRRVVIERAVQHSIMENRDIDFPLLAYKYGTEGEQAVDLDVDPSIIKAAAKEYSQNYHRLQGKITESKTADEPKSDNRQISHITTNKLLSKENFVFWAYEEQYKSLTTKQKEIVDDSSIDRPIRIDGAAGTGKTVALLLRAYKLLMTKKEKNEPFKVAFFTHSESTNARNRRIFESYKEGLSFLNPESIQSIEFITLLEYCRKRIGISEAKLIEQDAGESKDYQLLMIDDVIHEIHRDGTINTFRTHLSDKMRDLTEEENINAFCYLLQHEFSIQIKGRTSQLLDEYKKLSSIENGLPCKNEKDKEFVFTIFNKYQTELQRQGFFDVDDVTIEALSRLNAPLWRRDRKSEGYDYIIADEMHLFNKNEQSVFHYLSKDHLGKTIPLCFALDYAQAIGDRGDTKNDYISKEIKGVDQKHLNAIFRNSPQIADFCASIAASGTLMFHNSFIDPYKNGASSIFSYEEESRCEKPGLYMYPGEQEMIASIPKHISNIIKNYESKPCNIAVVWFDPGLDMSVVEELNKNDTFKHKFHLIDRAQTIGDSQEYVIAAPVDLNGLEFDAVIMVGVDNDRVPQKVGTSDISDHFLKYSAYSLLYLAASRARYSLHILGNEARGRSLCLKHAIECGALEMKDKGKNE